MGGSERGEEMFTMGSGVTLILQMGGIGIAGALLSNALEGQGRKGLASMISLGTYAVMGALALWEVEDLIEFTRRIFHI